MCTVIMPDRDIGAVPIDAGGEVECLSVCMHKVALLD
jgi:hypothetical protein